MASIPSFVHLGARSDASLGESIARVEELCWEAARDGQAFLALTDVDSLARAPRFAVEAQRAGIRPVFGAELSVLPLGETQFRGVVHRVRLLVDSAVGWRSLVRLVNAVRAAEGPGRPGAVAMARVLEDPRGLFLVAGGDRGELTALLRQGNFDGAEEWIRRLVEAWPEGRLLLELPGVDSPEGMALAEATRAVAGYLQLPTVAVPRVCCAHANDDLLFRWLHGTPGEVPPRTVGDLARPMEARNHLAPRALVGRLYSAFPEAMATTVELAEACAPFTLPVPTRRFPVHDFNRGVDAESYIWNTTFAKAAERYGELPPRYKERLNREFGEIKEAELADAVVTLVRLDEELERDGVQRGPGAGLLTNSLIASLLGLTRVDPLRFDLPFDLAPGLAQGSFPLLELSIPENQEPQAEEALRRLFGGQVAAVGQWTTWRPGAAAEWVGRRLGLEPRPLAALLRSGAFATARERLEEQPATYVPPADCALDSPEGIAWLAARMEGRAREFSAARGVYTFSVDPIEATLPMRHQLVEGAGGRTQAVCEWTGEELGRLRHGRIEFLHCELLDLIGQATQMAREQGDYQYTPERTPVGDPATYRLLREGNTAGIGPVEAPSIRRRLRQGQPVDLHQLIRLLASANDATLPDPVPFATLLLVHLAAAIKAHRPMAFYAAALTRTMGNAARTAMLLEEVRARGIRVAELDVNLSNWHWTVEREAIRPGFCLVEAMHRAAGEEIVLKRRELQFADVTEVVQRTDRARLRPVQLRALVKAGAFDRLGPSRAVVHEQLEEIIPRLAARRAAAAGDDLSFFGNDGQWWAQNAGATVAPPPVEFDAATLRAQEREACHPGLLEELSAADMEFLRGAQARTPRRLALKDAGQAMTLVGVVGPVESDPRLPGVVLCDVAGCLVRATGALADRLASPEMAGATALFTGVVERENLQWRMELAGLDTVPAARARAEAAHELHLDLSRVPTENWRPLLALLRAYPGGAEVRMRWMPAKAPWTLRRIARRRVLLCPRVEWGLGRLVGRDAWQPVTRGDVVPVESRGRAGWRRLVGLPFVRQMLAISRMW